MTKHTTMKKILAVPFMVFLLFGMFSCGDAHSKPYQSMVKDLDDVEKLILETNDCDELQMLNFSILGLHSDLENLQQDENVSELEVSELIDRVDGIEASWSGKMAAFGCNQFELEDDQLDTSGEDDSSYPSF